MLFKKSILSSCFLLITIFVFNSCTGKSNSSTVVSDTSSVQMKSGAATSSEMMTDTSITDSSAAKPEK